MMEQSCGQCKWFGGGKYTQHNRNTCNYPFPAWLFNRVTEGACHRLSDYVYASHGRDCRTFERRETP